MEKIENHDIGDDNDDKPVEILPARMTYLTPALIEQARTELNETDETKPKALVELRRLVEAETNLVTPTGDLFLLPFLRARKFDVKKAFKLIQKFYCFIRENRKAYEIADGNLVTSLLQRDYLGFLEHRDRDGCLVFIGKTGKWNPDIDSIDDLFRAFSGVLMYSLEHAATHIAGYRAIIDIRGVTWTQLKHFTPRNVLLLIRGTQFSFPGRYKGIHILSENRTLCFLWAVIYPFLTSKLKKRIFFHGEDVSPLLKHIHPSVLPVEFGGLAATYSNSRWEDVIYSRRAKIPDILLLGYKD